MLMDCIECPSAAEFIQNQFTASVLSQETENEAIVML